MRPKSSKKSGGQTLFTPERANIFCAKLAETGQVSKGAEILRVSRKTVYDWKDAYPEFSEAWDAALKIGLTRLEDEGIRRAADGVPEPVYYKGEVVGHVQKYSDSLLAFLLAAHKPEKYGKQKLEHSGPDGASLVPVSVTVNLVKPKPVKENK